MKKIIAIGLYVPGTGFTRVLQSIFAHLCTTYEVHWIGIGYSGPILESGYKIYPNNVNGGDAFGAYFACQLAVKINVDTILVLNDYWILKNYDSSFSNLPGHINKVAYVPLDGKIDQPSDIKGSSFFDRIVLYSKFAKRQTKFAFASLERNSEIEKIPKLTVIPHGVDLKLFKPSNKKICKRVVFSKTSSTDQAIFILNANRPVERKGIHLTILAYHKALSSFKVETFLVLHQAGLDSAESRANQELIKQLNITSNVIIDPLKSDGYVSDEELNLLYNSCDIGVNSSYGEGWGLISFEHAATGAAQIVPDHTSCTEIWKHSALLTSTRKDIVFDTNPFTMSEVSVDHLAKNMIKLVNNGKLRKSLGKRGMENAEKSKYNWKFIASQWKKIL